MKRCKVRSPDGRYRCDRIQGHAAPPTDRLHALHSEKFAVWTVCPEGCSHYVPLALGLVESTHRPTQGMP